MEEAVIKRIPPHNDEAERSVVGSMLMDPESIVIASDILTKEDFYNRQYGVIFEAIVSLYSEGVDIDLVTVVDRLAKMEVPPELSSVEFISNLVADVFTSAHIKHHANIVRDKAALRRLIKVSENITSNCYLDKDSVEEIMQDAEKGIFEVTQQKNSGEFEDIKQIVLRTLKKIEVVSKQSGVVTGVSTGFRDLDYKTTGLQPSDLILIAARPSMGKTAFVLNIAENVALRGDTTTAIFSLEMSKEQLVQRLLAMNSHVDSQKIRTGNLDEEEWGRLVTSVRKVGNSQLIIDDTPGISIMELRSKCRKLKLEKNLGLVIIDYLQLMSAGKHSDSRQQEISEISRSLKALAREINAPVIALSQLSRAVEQRPDKHPMLSDLRESGAIEQDADVVMFLYRDEYYNKDSDKKGIAEVIIGKQRNGPTTTVELAWLASLTKFGDLEYTRE